MDPHEYWTYLFSPQDNDAYKNAKFLNPINKQMEYVHIYVQMSNTSPLIWGLRRSLHDSLFYTRIPSYLRITNHSNLNLLKVRLNNEEFGMNILSPLVSKLVEMGFLTRLTPSEETAHEFGLI